MFICRKYAGSVLISRSDLNDYHRDVQVYSIRPSVLYRAVWKSITYLAKFFVLWEIWGIHMLDHIDLNTQYFFL